LAPLMGSGLTYPDEGRTTNDERVPSAFVLRPSSFVLSALAEQFHSPHTICVPLEPERYGGAVWAVPLWSERGLIGVLLLGEKRDGGLYTQEEIEIARAAGERLVDTQASAEMARRLMDLQRQRLTESQILDRRTRRVLHDEVLPRLHTAILQIAESRLQVSDGEHQRSTIDDLQSQLADVHRQIANLLHAMPPAAPPEVTRVGLLGALRQAVDSELGSAFDSVEWQIEQAAEPAAGNLSALNAEVIFYAAREAVRNAARYGRNGDSARPLRLSVAVLRRKGLEITIADDGVGLNAGVGASEGSGQGLSLHSTMMAVIGGSLTTESAPGTGTRVILALPDA
ncbi:MAG TPA: ATP-binding protein, partial [Roseiflexaceae bacterium]|nr:ATP-binding protein [Roseiflexaceae bacterium]